MILLSQSGHNVAHVSCHDVQKLTPKLTTIFDENST